jgi:DNA polymerase-3 subunit delta'
MADDDTTIAQPRLYPWQQVAVRDALANRERGPHALLLAGDEGIGKRAFAHALAQSLLCETPQSDGFACGRCASCRYVAASAHPDLRVLEPVEVDEDGNALPVEWIAIDRIRALIDWAQLTSHRGVAKVALIVPAERMFPAAANALLKTLEEPPPRTYMILASHQPGRLPPTIASRCVRMQAPRPQLDSAVQWLRSQGVDKAESVLAQAGGAPLSALAIADPGYQAERDVWLRALAKPGSLSTASLAARIDAAPRDERKARLGAAIEWLAGWTADLAFATAGGVVRRNIDRAAEVVALAAKVTPLALFRYHRSLTAERAQLSHPLTPRLVAESLLIEYRSMFN